MHAAPFAQWALFRMLFGGTFVPLLSGLSTSTMFKPGWPEVAYIVFKVFNTPHLIYIYVIYIIYIIYLYKYIYSFGSV